MRGLDVGVSANYCPVSDLGALRDSFYSHEVSLNMCLRTPAFRPRLRGSVGRPAPTPVAEASVDGFELEVSDRIETPADPCS